MNVFSPSDEVLRVTLLVLPESSMMSLASVLDTMRAANRLAGRELFEWKIATLNGKPLENCWIYQKDFTSGGLLELWLGPEPNKSWGGRPIRNPEESAGG